MKDFNYYKIELLSDAQPGTGLGGESVNDFVPRNAHNEPILPGAHLKGLMRENLAEMFRCLGWNTEILDFIFGKSFEQDDPFAESFIQITDAEPDKSVKTFFVSRTKLDEAGCAEDGSLRTVEAIPVGTVFRGKIYSHLAENSLEEKVWQLGFLSIFEVGGSRTRGCGQCKAELENFTKSYKELIDEISAGITDWKPSDLPEMGTVAPDLNTPLIPVCLTFFADAPVCVPGLASASQTNVQSTGFSIPASAVRGAIIRKLGNFSGHFMDELYESPNFIAWPLQPCSISPDKTQENLPVPFLVSLTHRAVKYSVDDKSIEKFWDEAIDDRNVMKTPSKAPLKASDGVLLCLEKGETPLLWKATTMPHEVRAHGVHNSGNQAERGLYTVDSMAPMTWRGLAVLPKAAADKLVAVLESSPQITFGTRRSVQGMGTLKAEILKQPPVEWESGNTDKTVLIVQSPISIPDDVRHNSPIASEQFLEMCQRILPKHGISADGIQVWANTGLLFGWNVKLKGLQAPHHVILPGSVIQFPEPIPSDKLVPLLQKGFFCVPDDYKRGYGAVSVHPGKAVEFFKGNVEIPTLEFDKQRLDVTKAILKLKRETRHLPSASQISALRDQLALDPKNIKAYFNNQRTRDRVYADWTETSVIENWLEKCQDDSGFREYVIQGLDYLVDLLITEGQKQN